MIIQWISHEHIATKIFLTRKAFRNSDILGPNCKMLVINFSFFHGSTAPVGLGPLIVEFCEITLRHTTLSMTPLDEWSALRRNLYLHNTQRSQVTDIRVSGGIRTRKPSKRKAADPRLKDAILCQLNWAIFTVWCHTWRKNWVNCAGLTGNSAGLRTVLLSRFLYRELRSSLREFHSFLSLPANTTMSHAQEDSQNWQKKLKNLMGNLCCAREHSVQFFVQYFYTVKLHILTYDVWGPLDCAATGTGNH